MGEEHESRREKAKLDLSLLPSHQRCLSASLSRAGACLATCLRALHDRVGFSPCWPPLCLLSCSSLSFKRKQKHRRQRTKEQSRGETCAYAYAYVCVGGWVCVCLWVCVLERRTLRARGGRGLLHHPRHRRFPQKEKTNAQKNGFTCKADERERERSARNDEEHPTCA